MKKRNIHKKNKLISILICTMFLFLICLKYQNYFNIGQKNNNIPQNNLIKKEFIEKNDSEILSNSVDLNYYRGYYNNNEIIARLEIPNILNIFITKTNNNDYYLNHSITKKKSITGNEFMDYRVNEESRQINIYGHNSKTLSTPFQLLENFLEKDFFDKNEYIILQFDNQIKTYQITAIKEVTNDFEHMKVNINKNTFESHLSVLKDNSIHNREVPYNSDSNILILQTCSYNNKDSYYIIVAIEI